MNIQIMQYKAEEECQVCTAFLRWQGVKHEVKETPDVLRYNNGKAGVLVFDDEELVAKGFIALVEFFESTGRIFT